MSNKYLLFRVVILEVFQDTNKETNVSWDKFWAGLGSRASTQKKSLGPIMRAFCSCFLGQQFCLDFYPPIVDCDEVFKSVFIGDA